MAKRKRLTPAALTESAVSPAPLETKALYPMGVAPSGVTRAPIAQVAGDTAAHAALEELASEVADARSSGRLVQALPLSDIRADHLLRDRMVSTGEDMEALKASLTARGQQTPIEVVELDEGGFGLISGFRRLTALQELAAKTGEARFDNIQALIKPKDSISDSYIAMVEENEIRSDLSFYERARLAVEAARLGIYPTPERAVQILFANAPSAKRSKIKSFIRIHDALGKVLRFPSAIPERLGLALTAALEKDNDLGRKLRDNMRNNPASTAAQERQLLERALRPETASTGAPKKARARKGDLTAITATSTSTQGAEVVPGIILTEQAGSLVLSGRNVTPALRNALTDWLSSRG